MAGMISKNLLGAGRIRTSMAQVVRTLELFSLQPQGLPNLSPDGGELAFCVFRSQVQLWGMIYFSV